MVSASYCFGCIVLCGGGVTPRNTAWSLVWAKSSGFGGSNRRQKLRTPQKSVNVCHPTARQHRCKHDVVHPIFPCSRFLCCTHVADLKVGEGGGGLAWHCMNILSLVLPMPASRLEIGGGLVVDLESNKMVFFGLCSPFASLSCFHGQVVNQI